jgi:hypothetical protein
VSVLSGGPPGPAKTTQCLSGNQGRKFFPLRLSLED